MSRLGTEKTRRKEQRAEHRRRKGEIPAEAEVLEGDFDDSDGNWTDLEEEEEQEQEKVKKKKTKLSDNVKNIASTVR